ncbi:hypothetical protein KY359_02590 [Candidatus Woesearchaeota archaeon]|nr:hypothetical protein [Candidatus Woesearchaeota archaeon]
MKKICVLFLVIALLTVQIAAAEMSASEAKSAWLTTKEHSMDMQEQHREAKLAFAGDKGEENRQAVVDTGKAVLHAALEEAEAWLVWKKLEAQENPEVPPDVLDSIENDVEANLAKIDELRGDVDAVENQVQLGLVWLKMLGKYFELVADVARNSGAMWVHIANEKADTIEEYAQKVRETAEDVGDESALEHVDEAMEELERARRNINDAEDTYADVRIPGTPLLKFAEGNNYLRAARANLISAHMHLNLAYAELMR